MNVAPHATIVGPFAPRRRGSASLDGAASRGYKRAMSGSFGIARRITGPAR
jgi:hypothetical protein